MGAARSFHMARLREADRHDRFRLYYPVAAGGTPIYVHAKIMIVDDVFLRVGSSNLNNRSLGLDTECDLGIEAHPGSSDEGTVRAAVRAVQRDLLSEHLATDPGTFAAAQKAANGSMIAAIERLRRPEGRTLSDLDPKPLNEVELQMVETRILDPERPVRPLRALRRRIL
jgi:phospholipase D1/2